MWNQNWFVLKLIALVALLAVMSGCSNSSHRSDEGPAFQVRFEFAGIGGTVVPPKTLVQVFVTFTRGGAPAPGVAVVVNATTTGTERFRVTTDANGRASVGLTAETQLPVDSISEVLAMDNNNRSSAIERLQVRPYNRDVAVSTDVWRNGELIQLALVRVAGVPLQERIYNAEFNFAEVLGDNVVPVVSSVLTNVEGRVTYQNQLRAGRYVVFGRDRVTNDIAPPRVVVVLPPASPQHPVLGLSFARQLDSQGNWLPNPVWWDAEAGRGRSFSFVFDGPQSPHSGGEVRIQGSGIDRRISVPAAATGVSWELPPPLVAGLVIVGGSLGLPVPGGLPVPTEFPPRPLWVDR